MFPQTSGPSLRLCVYSLVCVCVSMLDSHGACISSVNVCFSMLNSHGACISTCVNAGPPRSFYIILCECVFPCLTPTELVCLLVLGLMLDSNRAFISSCG